LEDSTHVLDALFFYSSFEVFEATRHVFPISFLSSTRDFPREPFSFPRPLLPLPLRRQFVVENFFFPLDDEDFDADKIVAPPAAPVAGGDKKAWDEEPEETWEQIAAREVL